MSAAGSKVVYCRICGTPIDKYVKICEMIAATSGRRDNVRKQVATEIRRGFLIANAISLINAETALGVKPASRKTKEAIDKIMKEQLPFMTPADAAAEAAIAAAEKGESVEAPPLAFDEDAEDEAFLEFAEAQNCAQRASHVECPSDLIRTFGPVGERTADVDGR